MSSGAFDPDYDNVAYGELDSMEAVKKNGGLSGIINPDSLFDDPESEEWVDDYDWDLDE